MIRGKATRTGDAPGIPWGALEEYLELFARDGYVVVPRALTAEEVGACNAAIDRDLQENLPLWQNRGNGRLQSVWALLAQPELDMTMRPPALLPLMQGILGPRICAEEHSVMIRGGSPEQTECVWHRDTQSVGDPPYMTSALSVVFYLTDVDETTHTFSVLPRTVRSATLEPLEAQDLSTARHLTGPAGTAILFNAALFHAGAVRQTPRERRTIHIYCGRSSAPPMSNHTVFPRRLWEGKDEETRRYYSRRNQITNLLLERF